MSQDRRQNKLDQEKILRLMGTVTSLDELGEGLLRLVMEGVPIDRGYFVLYEGDDDTGPRTARLLAVYDDRTPDVVRVDESHDFERNPIHQRLYRAQKPLIYNDLSELDERDRKMCQESGTKVFAVFPFMIQGRVGGTLLLDRKQDIPFTDVEISFLTSMLQQASLTISNLILLEKQRAEMQRELDRRTREMLTTTEVAQAVAAAPALDELFQRVVTLVKEQFNYYHAHVYEFVPEREELVLAAGYGEPGRIMVERGHRIPLGQGLNSTAVLTKRPVLVPNVNERDDWLPNPLLPDTRSELAVPIVMSGEVFGVLDVQQDTINGLTEADQSLLLNLCGQIATAIQNTRLLQQTQEGLRRTGLLLGLSTALSSLTQPQDLADALAEQLMSISSIERCSAVLCSQYDDQDVPQWAEVYAIRDRDPAFQGGIVLHQTYLLSDHAALFRQVIQGRQMLVVNDLAEDERLTDNERELMKREGATSFVVVPMVSGERVLGYFTIVNRQRYVFSVIDLEFYLGIANQSAVAFSNALSLSQLREAFDDLSRLYEASRAIATAGTSEMLTDIMIQQIVNANVDCCEISFYERHNKETDIIVVGRWAVGEEASRPGVRYRSNKHPLAKVAQQLDTRGTWVIRDIDVESMPEEVQAMFADRAIKALALVPLKAGDEYIGFLSIERHLSNSFSAEAIYLFETIASQSAVALRNVQLIDQSQNQIRELQKSYEEVARLADTVRQLSSPVIQIWEDVLVLPLVGAIDSQRAARVMEDLLSGITRYQAEQVIIDVTGVPVMDVAIANHLMQTFKAANLLGARCMLVGIDSEKAQTIVTLGLDWRGIRTYSNLRAGIQAALRELGLAVMSLSPTEGKQIL
jgi:GAF domain-containing protein